MFCCYGCLSGFIELDALSLCSRDATDRNLIPVDFPHPDLTDRHSKGWRRGKTFAAWPVAGGGFIVTSSASVVRSGKPIRHCSDFQKVTCNVLQRLDLLRFAFRTHRYSTRFRKLVSFRRTVGCAPSRYPESQTNSSSIGLPIPLTENWRCRICSPFVLCYDSIVTPGFRCRCVTLSGRV
jgi:hypothetical protein